MGPTSSTNLNLSASEHLADLMAELDGKEERAMGADQTAGGSGDGG
jgi:hypothetical protein